jgi:hypothetical protein
MILLGYLYLGLSSYLPHPTYKAQFVAVTRRRNIIVDNARITKLSDVSNMKETRRLFKIRAASSRDIGL